MPPSSSVPPPHSPPFVCAARLALLSVPPPRPCCCLVHAAASSMPLPSFHHPVVPLIRAAPTSMSPSSSLPLACCPATCLVPATCPVCAAPRLPPPSSMRAVWAMCFSVTHMGRGRVLVRGGLCGRCGWAGSGGGCHRRHLMVTPILQCTTRDNMDAQGQSQGHKSRVGIQCFTGCARGD